MLQGKIQNTLEGSDSNILEDEESDLSAERVHLGLAPTHIQWMQRTFKVSAHEDRNLSAERIHLGLEALNLRRQLPRYDSGYTAPFK